ncbi:MAG: hypothetical protein LBV51_01025 [Acholeplasmatales bacterium]|jgi:transposase|nr:hypothetical protein [Acholeplasmatales bacterium]
MRLIQNVIVDTDTNAHTNESVSIKSELNFEQLDKEIIYDGWFCIITSELDYTSQMIREIYHNLWNIEQTFRVTKTDLMFRPIFHFKKEHILGHFSICYVALVVLRYFQYYLKNITLIYL